MSSSGSQNTGVGVVNLAISSLSDIFYQYTACTTLRKFSKYTVGRFQDDFVLHMMAR